MLELELSTRVFLSMPEQCSLETKRNGNLLYFCLKEKLEEGYNATLTTEHENLFIYEGKIYPTLVSNKYKNVLLVLIDGETVLFINKKSGEIYSDEEYERIKLDVDSSEASDDDDYGDDCDDDDCDDGYFDDCITRFDAR
jgi:hypothetical protein